MTTAISLRDGSRTAIRPLEPEDRELLEAIWEDLSDRSRRLRFLTPVNELSPEDIDYLMSVDHNRHEAVIALEEDGQRPLGIARYVRVPGDREAAEAAVVVIDEWHGRGLGTALLEALTERARENGIRRYEFVVSDDNAIVLAALDKIGAERRSRTGEGEIEFVFGLPQDGLGERLQGALRAAAGGQVEFLAAVWRRLREWREWI